MKLMKLLKHDLIEGIAKRYIYLLLPVMIAIFSCTGLHFQIFQIHQDNINLGNVTIMDYWIFLVQGCKQYTFDVYTLFEIPVSWVGLYLFLLICLNNYPFRDLEEWGYQVILSSKSRVLWWISKVLWVICFVTIYFAVCFLSVVTYACIHGATVEFKASAQIMEYVAKRGFSSCSVECGIFINMLLPYLLMLVLGILQLLLSVRIPAIHAFLFLFGVLVLSTYRKSWLLLGNWAMPYRMKPISRSGLNPLICVLLLVSMAFVGAVAGYLLFRKKDIIEVSPS